MIRKFIVYPVLDLGVKVYGWILKKWLKFYEQNPKATTAVNARVISVGNITWGGTGKTPIVIMLARVLSSRGRRVVVLTRGYGKDEIYELKNNLSGVPVLVGRDRIKSARAAVDKYQAEVILLDDGFQHLRLKRNCDVVAINATDPFGNGQLIPRGCLREPVQNLKRAHVIVLTKASLGKHNINLIRQQVKEVNPEAGVFEADHRPLRFVDFKENRTIRLDAVRGKKTAILSGIEDPTSFERTLNRLGATTVYAARFDDHHVFTRGDIKTVMKDLHDVGADYLVTTAKDYYRLGHLLGEINKASIQLLVLQIGIRIDDLNAFINKCLHA